MKDLFDTPDYNTALVCSKCKEVLVDSYPISWPQETFVSKHHPDYATRLYNYIRHQIKKHKCSELPFNLLCSGYGVFPDGSKCLGCSDCNSAEGDAKAYNEVMSNQTFLDESQTNLQQR